MLQTRKQTQIKQILFEGAPTGSTLIYPFPLLHKKPDYLKGPF